VPAEYTLNYVAVALAALFSFGFVAFVFVLSRILAPRSQSPSSQILYESGIKPGGRGWTQVNLRFYLFALFFLIFDIEAVFLFPWALTFLDIGSLAFYEMLVFLGVLFLGLVYAWKKGVLQWK
jgi:NADH:ubiquinone oxidoreductase subunit 3 (subunit A)